VVMIVAGGSFRDGNFFSSFFFKRVFPVVRGGALIVDIGTLFSFLWFGSLLLMGQGGVGLEGVGWWWRF